MKKIYPFLSLTLIVFANCAYAQDPSEIVSLPSNAPLTTGQAAGIATGIQQIANMQGAAIYPNPAHDNLNIGLNMYDDAYVNIYSPTGQLLISQKINPDNFTVNLNGLPHSMYYVSIKNGGSVMMRPFPIIKE